METEEKSEQNGDPEKGSSDPIVMSTTSPQIIVTLLVCTVSLSCGTVLVWTSPALPDLEKSHYFKEFSNADKSWIASSVTLGALFSGVAGYLIDMVGRRQTLILLSFPLIFGWIVIACASTPLIMTIGRFLTGFSVGGFILSSTVYLAEISEQRIRGIVMSITSIALGTGILLTYVLGTFFSWFVITIVDTCLAIFLLLCVRTVPESPVYLLRKGQKKKAGEELMRLRGAVQFHQIEKELNELQSFTVEDPSHGTSNDAGAATTVKTSSSMWKNLTRKGSLKAIGISFALMIFQQLCGVNAVIFFTSNIFSAAKTNLDANVCAIIIGLDMLVAVFITSFLIDKLGRRILLFISLLGLAGCLSALGTFFYLQEQNGGVTPNGIGWIPLVSLMLFMILFHIGIGPLAWYLMGELIPTDVKGPASAAATSFNWLLAFIVTKTFEDFIALFGIYSCFFFFAGVCLVGFLFCYLFVPETRGKTLEEIQQLYFSAD